MVFNIFKLTYILPNVYTKDDVMVDEIKLLGIMVQSNLSWKANTTYFINKGYRKIWMLRNLKKLGANRDEMREVYIQQTLLQLFPKITALTIN